MDKTSTQKVLAKTGEVLLNENGKWLYFTEPQQIIIAHRLEEVLPALREIERSAEVKDVYSAGFLSYEAASAFDPALQTHASPLHATQATDFPYLWFGLYPKPRVVELPRPERPKEILNWESTTPRADYEASIAKIKEHIAQGRTYQVNYTIRLQTNFMGSAWEFFLNLVENQNNFAAYIYIGRFVICSASPELFFQLDGDTIQCRPMKGTAKRGRTTLEDNEQSEWLQNSTKNRAENVMIVDMIRNDLGRIANIGSVQVPKLFETKRYPTLWQMTSTVTAKTNASLSEIFAALFPCASLTGAPKVSTTKIITELENFERRIYTGSIGYLAPGRKAIFNVAIRTALIDRDNESAEYGVGGGVVWYSTNTDEYDEAILKARLLTESQLPFSLLETMLWTPEEGFFLSEKHIARLLDSAKYFDILVNRENLEAYLEQISSNFCALQRVRLLLDQAGRLDSESRPFLSESSLEPLKVCLAKSPVDSRDIFLFHKTTRRAVYESARAECEGFEDVLLYNESGELTEFTIGNLIVEIDGQLFTPPISCGVLPGTFRAYLLESEQVVERTLRIEQLPNCAKIFRVNSIRKWQAVDLSVSTLEKSLAAV
jgi:para-aminobenzoate synthetase/4-amino-4-deoxychorismate lyase